MKSAKPAPDRFWAKVDVKAPSECWEWTAGKFNSGYGIFYVSAKDRTCYAHRFSYELHNGPLVKGQVVMHSCDNPSCVNPAHLIVGTQSQNMKDMVSKNRQAKGARNGASKLDEIKVEEIRLKYATGKYSQAKIALEYGVTQSAIWHVIHKTIWSK